MSSQSEESPFKKDKWEPFESTADFEEIKQDHEVNPAYEIHIGREVKSELQTHTSRRMVSIWFEGKRYTGMVYSG